MMMKSFFFNFLLEHKNLIKILIFLVLIPVSQLKKKKKTEFECFHYLRKNMYGVSVIVVTN